MAAGVREIQPLAKVGVVSVGLAVVRGSLIRENGFRTVVERLEAGPDLIEARLQRVGAVGLHVRQGRHAGRKLAGVDLDASLISFGRPQAGSSLLARRRRQQGGCRIEVLYEIGR